MFSEKLIDEMTRKLGEAAGYAVARNVPGCLQALGRSLQCDGRFNEITMTCKVRLVADGPGRIDARVSGVSYNETRKFCDDDFSTLKFDDFSQELPFEGGGEAPAKPSLEEIGKRERLYRVCDMFSLRLVSLRHAITGDVYSRTRQPCRGWDAEVLLPSGVVDSVVGEIESSPDTLLIDRHALTDASRDKIAALPPRDGAGFRVVDSSVYSSESDYHELADRPY